jgi:outer membrane receptor protein involved in Fe transport
LDLITASNSSPCSTSRRRPVYDAGNREGDSYGLANVRLGLDGRSFGLSFWLQNAFDEEYVPLAFQPSPVDPTTFVGESGAPRVLGFSLSFHL